MFGRFSKTNGRKYLKHANKSVLHTSISSLKDPQWSKKFFKGILWVGKNCMYLKRFFQEPKRRDKTPFIKCLRYFICDFFLMLLKTTKKTLLKMIFSNKFLNWIRMQVLRIRAFILRKKPRKNINIIAIANLIHSLLRLKYKIVLYLNLYFFI